MVGTNTSKNKKYKFYNVYQIMMLHTKPQVTHTLEFLLQQRWVNTYHLRKGWNRKGITYGPYQILIRKYHWRLMKYFILKIIDKTGHGHMRQTQCHIKSLGRRDNTIYLQESMDGPKKSGLGKLTCTTMQPGAWLLVIYWNTLGQDIFTIITQWVQR